MSKSIFLTCSACAGLLEVPRDLSQFFCLYCGTPYALRWEGPNPNAVRQGEPLIKTSGPRIDESSRRALQRTEAEIKEIEDQFRDTLEDVTHDLDEENTLFDQIAQVEHAGGAVTRPADLLALGITLFCLVGGGLALWDARPLDPATLFERPLTRYPFVMTILGLLLLLGSGTAAIQRSAHRRLLDDQLKRQRERERARHEGRKTRVQRRHEEKLAQKRAELERIKAALGGPASGQT
ncbi:MAG: hypothetical protein HZA54_03805 [Planctomycetes bacterium]|nr:hypothetical protein [Planctomycetota bacterium]